jgi:hypothetical protein
MGEFELMRIDRNSIRTYARLVNKLDDCGHLFLQIKYTDVNKKQLGNILEHTVEDIEDYHSYIEVLAKPLETIWRNNKRIIKGRNND